MIARETGQMPEVLLAQTSQQESLEVTTHDIGQEHLHADPVHSSGKSAASHAEPAKDGSRQGGRGQGDLNHF